MTQHWEAIMSVGIIHFMVFPDCMKGSGPIIETLERIAADDFFSAVEITRILDSETRDKAKAVLASAHADVAYGAQPVLLMNQLNLCSPDAGERGKAVEEMKLCIAEAYEMGACGMAVLSGRDPGEAHREMAMAALADSLVELCRHGKETARDYELQIVLETFDQAVDKKCLVGPTRDAVKLADRVRQEVDNFGLMVDLSHLPLLGETPEECVSACIGYLVHAHAGNCILKDTSHPTYGDNHPRFGVPGGENDVEELAEFLSALLKAGYFGKRVASSRPILSFEVKPMAGESSEAVIANTKRVMRQAWGMVTAR
jgi:sugar phosphate isomerase/epimerase